MELRQRGDGSFLITISGRILMTSVAHRSETELAQLACDAIADRPRPRILVGGLGMGFTLRAALDRAPASAKITVVDLNPAVVGWCTGPLSALTKSATSDRRVRIVVGDVARVIADAPAGSYDAIVLDLYEGPHRATNRRSDPLYGDTVMKRWRAHGTGPASSRSGPSSRTRRSSGCFADRFDVTRHRSRWRPAPHVIYLGKRRAPPRSTSHFERPRRPTSP